MKAVTGSGAPSYTSGVQMWNGTRLNLKQSPIRNMPQPISSIALDIFAPASAASATEPVAPKISARPYKRNAEAVDERIRYLSAASRALERDESAQRQ
jgi:hypothetical protein